MLHNFIITNYVHSNDIGSFTEIMAAINNNRGVYIVPYKGLILLINQFHKKLCIGFLSLVNEIVTNVIFQ